MATRRRSVTSRDVPFRIEQPATSALVIWRAGVDEAVDQMLRIVMRTCDQRATEDRQTGKSLGSERSKSTCNRLPKKESRSNANSMTDGDCWSTTVQQLIHLLQEPSYLDLPLLECLTLHVLAR